MKKVFSIALCSLITGYSSNKEDVLQSLINFSKNDSNNSTKTYIWGNGLYQVFK